MTDKDTDGSHIRTVPAVAETLGRAAPQHQAGHHAHRGRARDPARAVGRAGSQVRSLRSAARSLPHLLLRRRRLGARHLLAARAVPRGHPLHGPEGDAHGRRGRQPVGARAGRYTTGSESARSFPLPRSRSTGRSRCCTSIGSRFFVRYLFSRTRNGKPPARVAIYGAGDAGARLSSVLLGGPHFEPVAFIDDKQALQGSQINGITRLRSAASCRSSCASTASSACCSRCPRLRAAGAARS